MQHEWWIVHRGLSATSELCLRGFCKRSLFEWHINGLDGGPPRPLASHVVPQGRIGAGMTKQPLQRQHIDACF